jgi:hypothetical protein
MIFKFSTFTCLFLFSISQLEFLEDEKIPEYLGIEVHTCKYRQFIRKFTTNSLREIYNKFRNHDTILNLLDLLDHTDKIQREPNSWHVTTLYIGDDLSKLDSPIYKHFKEDINVEIKISTLIFIPNKIIISPVFIENIEFENKYPHVTLFVGKYDNFESNNVLKAVFELPEYKQLYEAGKFKDENFLINAEINNLEVTLNDGHKEIIEKAYVFKGDDLTLLQGKTKKVYFK